MRVLWLWIQTLVSRWWEVWHTTYVIEHINLWAGVGYARCLLNGQVIEDERPPSMSPMRVYSGNMGIMCIYLYYLLVQLSLPGVQEPYFNGVKVKNQVLSCNMIRWFSPHPMKSCWLPVLMNMNLFNHNNNSTDNYDIVQLNSCGCWIVRLAKPALKTIQ